MRSCGSCGAQTPAGKFCIHCGTSTQQSCPSCKWDEALANAQALRGGGRDGQWSFQALVMSPWILVNRGQMAQALELLDPLSADTACRNLRSWRKAPAQ